MGLRDQIDQEAKKRKAQRDELREIREEISGLREEIRRAKGEMAEIKEKLIEVEETQDQIGKIDAKLGLMREALDEGATTAKRVAKTFDEKDQDLRTITRVSDDVSDLERRIRNQGTQVLLKQILVSLITLAIMILILWTGGMLKF
jgi:predicted  nucleic acid-binding Zn-ribbon protein